MNKREFLKKGLFAAGGLGFASSNAVSVFASQKPAISNVKGVLYTNNRSGSNKREKVLAVLDQSKPNEYIPAAFFLHFRDKLGQGAINSHLDFFRATNMDFVKIQYEIVVPHIDIKNPKEWSKIPVYKKDFFEPQLAVIEALAKELKSEALILPTVYSPLSLAYQTVGKDTLAHAKQDPDAVAKGLNNLASSIVNYIDEAINRGADGFYISTQGGNSKNFGEGELFKKLVIPYDLIVSQAASDKALLNILHVCDYGESYYANIRQFASYPGSIINAPNILLDGSPIKSPDVQKTFGRPVMGGLDRLGALAKGTVEEAKAAADKVLGEAAPNFILGADCTVPSETPYEKLRAVIDYAHDWRINHK